VVRIVVSLSGVLLVVAGCGRACGRSTASVTVSADAAVDAPAEASAITKSTGSPFRPIALVGWESRLHLLLDGTLLYSHGSTFERLEPDGRRERMMEMSAGGAIATAAGLLPDAFFVSTVVVNYPASTDATAWRVPPSGKAAKILRPDVFYLSIARWGHDRLLALRVKGAVHWGFYSLPWVPEGFVVLAGGRESSARVPRIPEKTFVEEFVAFPSGTVVAAATRYDEAMIARRSALALRWRADQVTPEVESVATQDTFLAEHIAARAEDDVWVAGGSSNRAEHRAWFSHHDGQSWTLEEAPFEGSVKSISVASDGALWAVSDGMLEQRANAVYRRDAFARGSTWSRIELPDVEAVSFATPPPRIKYSGGELRVDPRRHPYENPSSISASTLEPVQVVARGAEDVWVVATREFEGTTTILFHLGAPGDGGGPVGAIADVDEEESHLVDEPSRPDSPKCKSIFVSAGEPTPEALTRIKAAHQSSDLPVVTGWLDGKRTVGSYFGQNNREFADDLRNTWRKLGLPAEIRCGRPRLDALVVDSGSG
jgi:hypothetical protein